LRAKTILVAEDSSTIMAMIRDELEEAGHAVLAAENGKVALQILSEGGVDLVITDLVMPEVDGLELLESARKSHPDVPVILMSGIEKSADAAVTAIRQGAADYLIKPLKEGEVRFAAESALHQVELEEQVRYLSREVRERNSFSNIVGGNHRMREIFQTIEILADTDATVLITGETGTGKEMVARAIHFNSPRKERRFVPINCGALPAELLESELFGHEKGAFTGASRTRIGKFEYADGGTVFLDEIGEIPPAIQVKILRILQDKEFERVGGNQLLRADVRVIAATNKDLPQAISRGEFREDLFYRLNVVPLHMPPLRERKEDLPLLARHFLEKANQKLKKQVETISAEALGRIMLYHWPGNVRELENVIERAVIMERGPMIARIELPSVPADHLPANGGEALADQLVMLPLERAVDGFERLYLSRVLDRFSGNIGESAHHAGINPRTLNRKMTRHELDKKQFKKA